jgi:glycosyltransferase involved in cell wall biosynthesis
MADLSTQPDAAAPLPDAALPLVSMLLIAYRQGATVEAAIAGALAQTYEPLEIIVSDDASDDDTWQRIESAVTSYRGPHRLRLNRNPRNLGIGAHLSALAQMAQGELLFVAAGDDVSMPQRCERVVQAWLASGRKLDLIASALADIDAGGNLRGVITPSDLQSYRSLADWAARPPFVVGAAQAWTRRLVDRFGPLPASTVAEDLVMVFRAIGSGGALTLHEPLVRYRRGGVSRRVRNWRAADVIEKLLKNNCHALVETEQMLRDATMMNRREEVAAPLEAILARERFVAELFAAASTGSRWRAARRARAVPAGLRLRLFVYAAAPWLLAPFFALKRALRQR